MNLFKEKTIFEGNYSDVEEIAWQYGIKNYEMLEGEECSNSTYKRCTVFPIFSQKEWDSAVERNFKFCFEILLNRACYDHRIQPGEYFIDCSW